MMRIDPSRFLDGYVAVTTAAACWALLGGSVIGPKTFDTIDVKRINVRENDGTLRMVIAGRDNIGGAVVDGKEYPHPNRHEAGMIFYNDEATENGGLVFDGRFVDGKPTNGGSLTFDRWHQDQTIQMRSYEDGKDRSAAFVVNDRPDQPLRVDQAERLLAMSDGTAKIAALAAAGFTGKQRIYLGSQEDHSSILTLRDAMGRERLVLRVKANGAASIDFLDENGKLVRSTGPDG